MKVSKPEEIVVELLNTKQEKTVNSEQLLRRSDIYDNGTTFEDMENLENLNEAELLYNLQLRFAKDLIYTYVGPTLLVVNPFKLIEALFKRETLNIYFKIALRNQSYKDVAPHTYGKAATMYKQLFDSKKNQSLIISGESGAGKTETAKHAMQFLTTLCNTKLYKSD